ncbi:Sua5/YciO/YrdC/YwlC family protein [Blochmannia endosymbiont of Colobopsis nipponica]|uniref:Sua5/YciO/YrdC/YwlC family protein n=1 Tax=Blochmannia endosymbiont of Colobopsis nipponica TaxID=2681987 RepID=UPI0017814DF7|nr:Sua5/YciO/YrdC/YwlC family protein [Blochmannia endosymbiont of Colobopsis nipponica]QOI11199.1 Sua5/YciO/YrdC/YwlC family protein [Blochmannia endosymbiont of Colobopsis nipponica]
MNNKYYIRSVLEALQNGQVIAYPTETILSLGCDPDNFNAVKRLLKIKQRSWKKGFILVGANCSQFFRYIDEAYLTYHYCMKIRTVYSQPITWVIPARFTTPCWLTGRFSSVAVRLSIFKPLQELCLSFGKALISTSANLSGYSPVYTFDDIYRQFGNYVYVPPVLNTKIVNKRSNPSGIRDIITGAWLRY